MVNSIFVATRREHMENTRLFLPPQAERSEAEEAIHRRSRTRNNTARSEPQAFSQFRIVFIGRFYRRRKLLMTLYHKKLNAQPGAITVSVKFN